MFEVMQDAVYSMQYTVYRIEEIQDAVYSMQYTGLRRFP